MCIKTKLRTSNIFSKSVVVSNLIDLQTNLFSKTVRSTYHILLKLSCLYLLKSDTRKYIYV